MEIKYALLMMNGVKLKQRESVKLRGYIANKYNHYLLHNHLGDKMLFKYPKVQYKVIDGKPILLGINEGAMLVVNIGLDNEEIIIDDLKIPIESQEIIKKDVAFGEIDDYKHYKFITPWLALNESNYTKYISSNQIEREEILKKTLIGNIISMCKGIGYTVTHELKCWLNVYECEVNFKGVKMIGFKGDFKINFNIPEYLGIGKSVSRGFGTVKETNNDFE